MKDDIIIPVILIVACIVFVIIGVGIGASNERRDAVKAGVAYYTSYPSGCPKFKYITEHNE